MLYKKRERTSMFEGLEIIKAVPDVYVFSETMPGVVDNRSLRNVGISHREPHRRPCDLG
jgi:hypothetical protein